MWNLKTTITIVIVEALWMIKKGTDKHSNKIPGSPNLYKIQNALCGTAHLLRKVLSM